MVTNRPTLKVFVQEPSANVAITHDNEWIALLEEVRFKSYPMLRADLGIPPESDLSRKP